MTASGNAAAVAERDQSGGRRVRAGGGGRVVFLVGRDGHEASGAGTGKVRRKQGNTWAGEGMGGSKVRGVAENTGHHRSPGPSHGQKRRSGRARTHQVPGEEGEATFGVETAVTGERSAPDVRRWAARLCKTNTMHPE